MKTQSHKSAENDRKLGEVRHRPYSMLAVSIVSRALHQLGAAIFLAVYLLDILSRPPLGYITVASVSGGVLFVLEWWRHRELYKETAGVITILKVMALGAVYHGFLPTKVTILAVFLVASVGAHAPKHIRHRLLC